MHPRHAALGTLALLCFNASPTLAQSVSDVFKQVHRAVVVVHTAERNLASGVPGQVVTVGGLGSGVLVSNNGEVLTAAHVVQSAERVLVEFPTGEEIPAIVVGSVPSADLALLRLEHRPMGVLPVPVGNSDSVEIGDQVIVIGAPLGVSHTLTVGHVSGRRRLDRTLGTLFQAELLQTDAAINQGNSGGPMFNMAGEVVGIVSHIISQTGASVGLGFVITSNMARELLLDGVSVWSGIDGFYLNDAMGSLFNVPPPGAGMLVQRVAQGSLGESLGLEGGVITAKILETDLILGGDIILTVQNISLNPNRFDAIRTALGNLTAGQQIVVTVLRAGEVITLSAPFVPR